MYKFYRFNHILATMCASTIILALLFPGDALAKSRKSLGWDNVTRLTRGSQVVVQLVKEKRYAGKVVEVRDSEIQLTTATGNLEVPKEEIASITRIGSPKFANPGLWMGVGGSLLAGVGRLVGDAKDLNDINSGKLNGGQHGQALVIAGVAVAVAGIATFIIVGKPRVIYERASAPSGASN